ncbi:ATP-binding cassette domain-containing protein [Subtercola sp. PAMC28395]|uniref:ATP-binding cassette domain-containing protein n=1 Tax=Subtercola sp. PAMC28395 TaxID=2846775 RepID=UPI001C0C68F1|nr:ATP-binding cassette domain-containing protein [Subtercola sp. PAMC28395]QWT24832.1 ATP-binding cassette domain-containing protein [Subtercola sp. PAMC28395]
MPVPTPILRLSSVSARSSAGTGIRAVSFEVRRGSVHGVLGENLSGSSELLAALSGYLPVTEGVLELDGVPTVFDGHAEAEAAGVAVVRGRPSVVPHLSVAENVFLGRERAVRGFVKFDRLHSETTAILAQLGAGATVKAARPAGDLTPGERWVVELARAVAAERRVLLLDEPFTGLDATGLSLVSTAIDRLASDGMTVVVATHRIDQLRRIAETVTVLSRGSAVETIGLRRAPRRRAGEPGGDQAGSHKDSGGHGELRGGAGFGDDGAIGGIPHGDTGGTGETGGSGDASTERLIGYMTANLRVTRRVLHESIEPGPVVLEVKRWSAFDPLETTRAVVRQVSLSVRRGEIVGLAGLEGSGISELALSLFGRSWGSSATGEIEVNGRMLAARNPQESIAGGLSLSTDANVKYDLQLLGGIPSRISASMLARLARLGLVDRGRDYETAAPAFGLGGISELVSGRGGKGSGAGAAKAMGGTGGAVSAGEQRHREALELWLGQPEEVRPAVVMLDHPTRGASAEGVQQLRDLIVELAASGTGVLLASADLDELLVMTTRVYTLFEGRVTAEIDTRTATPQSLLARMIGPA